MKRQSLFLLVAFYAVVASGCGADAVNYKTAMTDPSSGRSAATGVAAPGATRSSSDFQMAGKGAMPGSAGMGGRTNPMTEAAAYGDAVPSAPAAAPKSAPRKILYTADIALVSETFAKTADEIVAAVRKFDGFVADQDVNGSVGGNRHGTWKVRIPVERFDSFLDGITRLGELQRRQIHSQDVTEEYYDLDARIKNKKVEEGRLVKHLEESTGKLTEILAVEKEVSRVREEIERMEGRIRLLANLAELTTVTIVLDEQTKFIPATSPTFATRARRTFEASVKAVGDFLEGLALLVLWIVPWLPFWIVLGLIVWFFVRRIRRSMAVTRGPTTV